MIYPPPLQSCRRFNRRWRALQPPNHLKIPLDLRRRLKAHSSSVSCASTARQTPFFLIADMEVRTECPPPPRLSMSLKTLSLSSTGLCFTCAVDILKKTGECFLCRQTIVKIAQIEVKQKLGKYRKIVAIANIVNPTEHLQEEPIDQCSGFREGTHRRE